MTYVPQDFRGTIIRQQKERSERNRQAVIDALVSSGGSIHDKYALLWKQQMDRRKQLAELGSATGVYKTMMKYLVGVPEVLMDFVRQINDDQGPMEEQRQRYGPPLYSLTRMVYSICLFLTLLWGRLETQKLQKDQISVLEEAANVYTSELERFIKFIGEVFTNSPFLITAEDAGALTARKNDEYKEISVPAGETHEDIFSKAILHPGPPQDFALQTVQQVIKPQKQVKLVQEENMLLENILRTLLQELVSAAVESGEAIMQYGQSIVDEDARPAQIPRLLARALCQREACYAENMQSAASSPIEGSSIDFNFYKTFWSLQESFSNPASLVSTVTKWQKFTSSLTVVKSTFEAQHLSDEEGNAINLEDEASNFSIKYLTSSLLMGLELKDPSFRQHILVQCLILFDYLKGKMTKIFHQIQWLAQRIVRGDVPERLLNRKVKEIFRGVKCQLVNSPVSVWGYSWAISRFNETFLDQRSCTRDK